MLQFDGQGEKCSKCIDFWGFRAVCVIFIGLTIGWMGLQFVATPPSVILLTESTKHHKETAEIIKRLSKVEKLVIELKNDVKKIKDEIIKPNKAGK
jgi:hypothetical protein